MRKQNCYNVRILLCLIMGTVISCSGTKEIKNDMCIPLRASLESEFQSTDIDLLENVTLVPLETTDESLLGECHIIDTYTDEIIVSDISSIYIFDGKTGKYKSKISKLGNGPEEYVSLNDVAVDYLNRSFYILDGQGAVKKFSFDGDYLKEYRNDSIVSMAFMKKTGFVAFNNSAKQYDYDINLYDKDWNLLKHLHKKAGNVVDYKDIVEIRDFHMFNGVTCIMNADTLSEINNGNVQPLFYIDKGNLVMPLEVFTDLKRKKERMSYIWGDYGFLVGNYYFMRFYYDNKIYYDIWDISHMNLLFRNFVETSADSKGMPLVVDGKEINVWPSFVKEDMIYCILMDGEIEKLGISDNNGGNPVILVGKIRKM